MNFEHWMLIATMSGGLALAGCGGAEVQADEDPGEEPADFQAETQGDITEGDVGADVDISEGDETATDPDMGAEEPY